MFIYLWTINRVYCIAITKFTVFMYFVNSSFPFNNNNFLSYYVNQFIELSFISLTEVYAESIYRYLCGYNNSTDADPACPAIGRKYPGQSRNHC